MTRQLDSYDAFCFDTLRQNAARPTTGEVECACRDYLVREGYTDAVVMPPRRQTTPLS